jgi:hypothetical protein
MRFRSVGLAALLLLWCAATASADTVLKRQGPTLSPSPHTDRTGWDTHFTSATHTIQTSPAYGGEPTTVKYMWDVPETVPAGGATGTLTIEVNAGSERSGPAFQIVSRMVHCDGIENVKSYGTGCADGDHAAVGAFVEAHESATVTQKFKIRGPIDRENPVRIVTGGPDYVDFTYTAVNTTPPAPSAPSLTAPSFGKPVFAPLPQGDSLVLGSPKIGPSMKSAAIDVVFAGGLTDNAVVVPDLGRLRTALRIRCYVIAAAESEYADYAIMTKAGPMRDDTLDEPIQLSFMSCLNYVETFLAKVAAGEIKARAAAACPLAPLSFRVTRKGRTMISTPLRRAATPALRVSCRPIVNGVRVTVRARRGRLRSITGPRLKLIVARLPNAQGATSVGATFRR